MLELKNVSKSYREARTRRGVLEDVNLAIERGEFVAVTGRSGTGKSTLLNLISGIDLPDRGTVMLDGVDLIPTLSVAENLLLPLELIGTESAAAAKRVTGMLERIELASRGDSFPDTLSGGEQQRVAVARALIHEPDLVLADEPTGNLDEETGRMVLSLLCEMSRDAGKTLVVVTHSRESAARAGRVLRIDDGHILEASGDAPTAPTG
jgi:putative ABC transport system ATP-binding protein